MRNAGTADNLGLRFMALGLLALTASLVIGLAAAAKFLYPEILALLPFEKARPLHVSLAVSWIFLVAVGGVYYYLPGFCRLPLFSRRAAAWHFWIFLATGLAVIASYLTGRFGGREYWEFPPILALPMFFTWILFGINYFATVRRQKGPWPVYYWMWGTGIVFFFISFAESYLWVLPYFRESIIRELVVQWKSYGSLVGSWNMLVYGTAIFVMEKISGEDGLARSKMAFGLYFLGLSGLMFGWAHHVYPLPFSPTVRMVAYVVSMTELLILAKIIWDWRSTLTDLRKYEHCQAYRFLFAADIWIFLNLILAILMSVPSANLFTHGTHITVAHAMGTTIGINTMILLASVYFVIESRLEPERDCTGGGIAAGFWLANLSLLIFLAGLIGAGIGEAANADASFFERAEAARPYLLAFAVAGGGLVVGLSMVIVPAFLSFARKRAVL